MKRAAHLAMIGAVGLAALCGAQGQPPSPPEDGAREPRRDFSPQSARDRLQRRRDEARRNLERLEKALTDLDEGRPVAEVMREIEPPRGDRPPRGEGLGHEDRPRGPEGGPRVSPEEAEALRPFVREHLPKVHEKIEALRAENPDLADRWFGRMVPRLREARAAQERDPRLFTLRISEIDNGLRVFGAIGDYRRALAAPDDQQDRADRLAAAEATLRDALREQVDLRLRTQEHEITRLEKRLESMRGDLQRKQADKDQTVADLLGLVKSGRSIEPDRGGRRPDRE
jgi:hypothetical protein